MLTRDPGEFKGVRRGARMVAARQFEYGRDRSSKRERAEMGQAVTRVCMRSMSEIARSTSPRGHDAIASQPIAATPWSCP